MNLSVLRDVYFKRCEITKEINSLKDGIYDLSVEEFLFAVSFFTPQSYGTKLQKFVMKKLGLTKVPSSIDLGDAKDIDNGYCEIKCSLINDTNSNINLVQLRLWQKVDYYIVGVFIVEKSQIELFKLTKDDMIRECYILKATSAHMTKHSIKNNENVELRMSISVDSDMYKRWLETYKI